MLTFRASEWQLTSAANKGLVGEHSIALSKSAGSRVAKESGPCRVRTRIAHCASHASAACATICALELNATRTSCLAGWLALLSASALLSNSIIQIDRALSKKRDQQQQQVLLALPRPPPQPTLLKKGGPKQSCLAWPSKGQLGDLCGCVLGELGELLLATPFWQRHYALSTAQTQTEPARE